MYKTQLQPNKRQRQSHLQVIRDMTSVAEQKKIVLSNEIPIDLFISALYTTRIIHKLKHKRHI